MQCSVANTTKIQVSQDHKTRNGLSQASEFRPLPLNVNISLTGVTACKTVSNLLCSAGRKPMWC